MNPAFVMRNRLFLHPIFMSKFGFYLDSSVSCSAHDFCTILNGGIGLGLQFFKRSVAQYENDLTSVVHSLILSISENDLNFVKSGQCNSSCIKFDLVKLLRLSGYDAAVCAARWQVTGKVPGGMLFVSILQKLNFIEFGLFFPAVVLSLGA